MEPVATRGDSIRSSRRRKTSISQISLDLSCAENLLVVPVQELPRRPLGGVVGECDQRASVQGVVLFPVVELLTDPWAHFDPVVGRHGHVARVEERVQVRSQQKAVACPVGAAFGVLPDVGGLQHWQGLLARHGAMGAVCL